MTKEELQAISELLDEKFKAQEERIMGELSTIKDDISELKESTEEIRSATNYVAEWVEKLDVAFKTHEIVKH